MAAERGTKPHTEEFAVYVGEDPSPTTTVVRRFSNNDPSGSYFTIDADIIEEIGAASGRADARHSHTVVQKVSTNEDHVDQKRIRTNRVESRAGSYYFNSGIIDPPRKGRFLIKLVPHL